MTKNQENKFERGSEWRKWDLHIHTPASFHYDYRGEDGFDRLARAINNSDVEAFAIIDYYTLDGYKQLIKAERQITKVIFPGIELRLENSILPSRHGEPHAESDKPIHLQIIFDNDQKLFPKIEEFVSSLDFDDFHGHKPNLERENIIKLGRSKQSNQQLSDDEAYRKGCGQIRIAKELVTRKLEEKGLRDHAFIVLPYEKYGGIDPIDPENDSLIKTKLTKMAHFMESSRVNQVEFFLGKSESLPLYKENGKKNEDFITFIGQPKPCINCSDSHHPNTVGVFSDNKCCWIKGDLTFEGLRQIIFEPDLRVRIQPENPSETETYALLNECSINLPTDLKIITEPPGKKEKFCLQGIYQFVFSSNLNCIIGGRGSGKSTLVHILYNALGRSDGRLREVDSPLTNLDLRPEPLSKIGALTSVEIPNNIEFFLQNEIEKRAKNIQKMSELVRHRLLRLSSAEADKESLEELRVKWSQAREKVEELVVAFDKISTSDREIRSLRKEIATLQKQIAVIKSDEYKQLQLDIDELTKKLSSFNKYNEQYESLTKKIDDLIDTIDGLHWSKQEGQDLTERLKGDLKKYKNELSAKHTDRNSEYTEQNFPEQLNTKKQELRKYLEKRGLSPENIGELTDATERIDKLEDSIRSLREQKTPHEGVYKEKDKILLDYKEKYQNYHTRFFEGASLLEDKLSELSFSNKQITFTPNVNVNPLKKLAADFVKENAPTDVRLKEDDIQNVLFDTDVVKDFSDYISNKDNIKECVSKSDRATIHKQILQELVNDDIFLERIYLRMWQNYFDVGNIQVQTKLGEKPLQNTSFGERCGIVIAITLVAGTNPIIIDQPEDNLDGKFISNVLVPLIRVQKMNRQITLITRDANIVIGADAELILILEEGDDKTELIPSSIENVANRERYIWILDGGKEAFEKREQKYHLASKGY